MSDSQENREPILFISHKHIDSKIADIVRSFVEMYSGGRVKVFQSSSPWADSPKVGRNLNRQLKETLWQADVLILIYTAEENDWNYCMWECGVASHPHSPETKIILFKCSATTPALFSDQVNVNARELVDIQKFADEFLTDSQFFPRFGNAVTAFPSHGQQVATAAVDLHQKLQDVLPSEKDDPSIEWPAYPYLQLELNFEEVDRIVETEAGKRLKVASEIILNNAEISTCDKYAEQLFAVPSFPRGMRFQEIVNIWRERFPDCQSQWAEVLVRQLMDGALWRFPTSKWEPMQGLSDEIWRAPQVTRVRKIPNKKAMQFDIYFFKFEPNSNKTGIEIKLPKDEG